MLSACITRISAPVSSHPGPASAARPAPPALRRSVIRRGDLRGNDNPADAEATANNTNIGLPKSPDSMSNIGTKAATYRAQKDAEAIGSKPASGKPNVEEGPKAADQKVKEQVEWRNDSGVDRLEEAVQGAFNLFGAAPVATGTEAGTKEEA